jgi:5-methyltetrahydrofolate corrinoid/iron sulfur protein methyltransferase
MKPTRAGTPFLVVGENIHATRILKRGGRHVVEAPDGTCAVAFTDADGDLRALPVHPAVAAGRDFGAGRVKHVASAVRWGLDDGPEAEIAEDYVRAMAARQEAAGADWLDLNADEVAPDSGTRVAAMEWLVATVEATAGVPVSIDSSDVAVLRAGVAASRRPMGAPLVNSVSLEHPELLEWVAAVGPVVLAATGPGGMPADAEARVRNATALLEAAFRAGVAPSDALLDPLVLPVGVAPDAGAHALEAARRLRTDFGTEFHLTGGLSNVSFGMPARRLLNDVFIDLAAEAGFDSGIIDPVASDLGRVFTLDRETDAWRLAADLLLGRDMFGGEFVGAFRAGRLAEAMGD